MSTLYIKRNAGLSREGLLPRHAHLSVAVAVAAVAGENININVNVYDRHRGLAGQPNGTVSQTGSYRGGWARG